MIKKIKADILEVMTVGKLLWIRQTGEASEEVIFELTLQ